MASSSGASWGKEGAAQAVGMKDCFLMLWLKRQCEVRTSKANS